MEPRQECLGSVDATRQKDGREERESANGQIPELAWRGTEVSTVGEGKSTCDIRLQQQMGIKNVRRGNDGSGAGAGMK